MKALLQRIRDTLLATEDTVCLERARLVTEAWREHEHEPPPLRRSHAFAHVLRHMGLDVDSNPLFAGNTSARPRAWMLIPEHGFGSTPQVELENACLRGHLDERIPQDLLDYWVSRSFGGVCGIGHLAVDMHRLVHEGLDALLAETRAHALDGDAEQQVYRRAMALALEAVVDWARRYAEAADAAARSAKDPVVHAAHKRVAAACRRVPAQPARDLFEGLQAMVLVHLATAIEGHGMSISIGLPDRVLAPFIDDAFDPEAATDLVGAFLLKVAANSVFGRGSKTQAITVGGLDHRGEDQCNALTRCFLDACERMRVGDPHVFLRWHKHIDPAVKQQAATMLAAGVSMPLLIHDVPTAQGFVNAGVAPEDAWAYCVIGCNELGIPGRSAESATAVAGTVQYIEWLTHTLLDHPDPDGIADMPALLACLEARMARRTHDMRRRGELRRTQVAASMPTPFTSALMRGCIARGRDMMVGMDYHLPGVYERGLTNAVNALAAIDDVVFTRRELSMAQLVEAMRGDFGDPTVPRRLMAAPKWGNDDPQADRWALALVAMRERVLNAVDAELGGRPHMACHVVRSLHHLDGQRIPASPDGRRAHTPVADSIGAQTGTAHRGPTAVLRSVLKLDAAHNYRGGYNLNLTLPGHKADPTTVRALAEGFFAQGGQELQVACLDPATLRAAREHPERHGELMVRISGFSARFVDIAPTEQDELIARAEAAARR